MRESKTYNVPVLAVYFHKILSECPHNVKTCCTPLNVEFHAGALLFILRNVGNGKQALDEVYEPEQVSILDVPSVGVRKGFIKWVSGVQNAHKSQRK